MQLLKQKNVHSTVSVRSTSVTLFPIWMAGYKPIHDKNTQKKHILSKYYMLHNIAMVVENIYQFTLHSHPLNNPIYKKCLFLIKKINSRQFKGENSP